MRGVFQHDPGALVFYQVTSIGQEAQGKSITRAVLREDSLSVSVY